MSSENALTHLAEQIAALPKGKNLVYYTGSAMVPVPAPIKKLVSIYANEGIVSKHMKRHDKDTMQFIVQKRV
jgi:hypothetical protein